MEQTQQRNSQNARLQEQSDSLAKKKRPKEDILEIVRQFITYFEETDRSKRE